MLRPSQHFLWFYVVFVSPRVSLVSLEVLKKTLEKTNQTNIKPKNMLRAIQKNKRKNKNTYSGDSWQSLAGCVGCLSGLGKWLPGRPCQESDFLFCFIISDTTMSFTVTKNGVGILLGIYGNEFWRANGDFSTLCKVFQYLQVCNLITYSWPNI